MARQKSKDTFVFNPEDPGVVAAIEAGDIVVRSIKSNGNPIEVTLPGGAKVPVTRYVAVRAKGATALVRGLQSAVIAAINRFVAQSQDAAIRAAAEKPLEVRMEKAASIVLDAIFKAQGLVFDPKNNSEHHDALVAKALEFANTARAAGSVS